MNYGGTEGDCNSNMEISRREHDKDEVTSEECKAIDMGNATSEIVTQKMDNTSADPLVNCYLDVCCLLK